jgi:hypothetical protein
MQRTIETQWEEQGRTATGQCHAELIASREGPPLKDVDNQFTSSGNVTTLRFLFTFFWGDYERYRDITTAIRPSGGIALIRLPR